MAAQVAEVAGAAANDVAHPGKAEHEAMGLATKAELQALPASTSGDKGDPGEPGADGASAYDIARDHGYGGTETQWLATLKGEPGERGEQGLKGDKGDPGTPGTPGTDGQDGAPGGAADPVYAVLANGATAMAFGTNDAVKVTPTGNATLTTTVPAAGKRVTLIVLTNATQSRTITFGTGFRAVSTLATGTTSGRVFVISFVSDGSVLYEASRTAAMVA